jgi:anti-sigma regulatory factor (Ser/Thr protein kinase)
MEIAFTETVAISDSSSVGEARRTAAIAAKKLHMDETRSGELAILATEAARNVLIHGGGGQVIVSGAHNHAGPLARILALDKGKGIDNLGLALSDGYSTAGTMGAGLGAMKRLANRFEVFTGKGGTMVLLELGSAHAAAGVEVAGMALPFPGEQLCGDAWWYDQTPERTAAILIDGLGHGIGAADAAQEAIAVFRQHASRSPGDILSYTHDALKKTRGAVAGVVAITPAQGDLTWAGVGNIYAALVIGEKSKGLVSHNGTLGMLAPRIQEFHAQWRPDSVFVMHSDGLHTKWDLSSFGGLISRPPALICGALIRDFRRQRDDASVVVIKGCS